MDIRHLKTFKTIVDVGGFMKAAEFLGYAQPTVTGHIRAIEQELGRPLFNRFGKRMVLTDVGRHLLPYANDIVALMDKASQLPPSEDEATGKIVIGASESLTTYRLPSVLKTFKGRYPKVKIILKPLTSEALLQELRQGKIDISFLMDTVLTEDDLCTEQLVTEKMVLVLPKNHPDAFTDTRNYPWSEKETILYTEQGCSYRSLFENGLQDRGIAPKNTLEFWSVEAIKQCIMCGLGLSFLPFATVRTEWEEHKLSCIPSDEDRMITQMVYHKNKWLSPTLKLFMNLVREQAANWQNEALDFNRETAAENGAEHHEP